MAIMMGDTMTNGALAGSVLFVGAGPVLAQVNANFYYEVATNTIKSKDQPTTPTSNLNIATGSVTTGNGSASSGALAINTGGGGSLIWLPAARRATRARSRSAAARAARPAVAQPRARRATYS